MKTISLHLAGPIQSWAGPALVKTRVDTDRSPSARAIRGLLTSTWGIPREDSIPSEIEEAKIEISTLSPGEVIRDFQTISNRAGEEKYLNRIGRVLNRGKRPPGVNVADNGGFQSIVRRTYLADARFLVLVTGRNEDETQEIYSRLLEPVWSPYLGRKAFTPTFPFILGIFEADEARQKSMDLLDKIGVK